MHESIEKIEATVMRWLKEENMKPVKLEDPNSLFNLKIHPSKGRVLNISCPSSGGKIAVGTGVFYLPVYKELLHNHMSIEERREYFWKLRTQLLLHPCLAIFQIPKGPEVFEYVRMQSYHLYFEVLTKNSLMYLITQMNKVINLPIWNLDRYIKKYMPDWRPPKGPPKDSDSAELEKWM